MGFVVADDTVLIADGGLATELEARGIDHDETVTLFRRNVEFAVDARVEAGVCGALDDRKRGEAGRSGSSTKQRRVAASVGPNGAARADGSESASR